MFLQSNWFDFLFQDLNLNILCSVWYFPSQVLILFLVVESSWTETYRKCCFFDVPRFSYSLFFSSTRWFFHQSVSRLLLTWCRQLISKNPGIYPLHRIWSSVWWKLSNALIFLRRLNIQTRPPRIPPVWLPPSKPQSKIWNRITLSDWTLSS